MNDVVTAVLGGGQGTRLWPLTRERAKPSVPVGGKFRLIDIPISNSLHANIDRIYVLTQFNSASLHRHIAQTFRFDHFREGFVNILAAEQTLDSTDWYQGTADAVRQNLDRLTYWHAKQVMVLSGDQLYSMDLREFLDLHRQRQAEISIAVKPVSRAEASGLGIMKVAADGRIIEFVEKPTEPEVLDALTLEPDALARLGYEVEEPSLLASMGIYIFDTEPLQESLRGTDATDFGKEVIPRAIHDYRVFAYGYTGYWRDIGTIPAFHHANLELAAPLPPLNLYDALHPIFTHPRFLPGTKLQHCEVNHSVLCEGSVITGRRIDESVIGIRSRIREGSVLQRTVMMGANSYDIYAEHADSDVPVGVGRGCRIEGAIIDTNARIGDGCELVNHRGVEDEDGDFYAIRGGVIVIPRAAVVPPGTVL